MCPARLHLPSLPSFHVLASYDDVEALAEVELDATVLLSPEQGRPPSCSGRHTARTWPCPAATPLGLRTMTLALREFPGAHAREYGSPPHWSRQTRRRAAPPHAMTDATIARGHHRANQLSLVMREVKVTV